MLKNLRKKENAKKIFIILAIVIIPAFVLWGSFGLRSQRGLNYAGKIFGHKVTLQEFQNSLNACKNQALIQFGENFYKVQKFLNLNVEAWDRLILLSEAKKRKIKTNDKQVIEAVQNYDFFQKDGKFSPEIYQEILEYVFRTPARAFEEEIRQGLIMERLFNLITDSVMVSDAEVLKEYKKENEQVKVSYVFIPSGLFENEVVVEEVEIQDYYQAHKDIFKKPPMVNIQYLALEYPADAVEEEKTKAQEKSKQIYDALKKDNSLDKASLTYSLPIKETGLFSLAGPVTDIGWSYEFISSAFSLKENEISNPICTVRGCYILRLKEKRPSYSPPIEEAKEEIKKKIALEKSRKKALEKSQEYLQKLEVAFQKTSLDFASAIKELGLTVTETPLFKYGDYIQNVGLSKEFQDAAFKLTKDSPLSELVETNQVFYILNLQELIPFDEKKFSEEKNTFQEKILAQKKKEYFNKFFESLKKQSNLEDNISKLVANP